MTAVVKKWLADGKGSVGAMAPTGIWLGIPDLSDRLNDEVFDLKDPDEILASRHKEEELIEMLVEAGLGIPLQSNPNKPQGDSITSDPYSLRQKMKTLADFLPLNMSTEFSDKILNLRLDKVIQNLSLGKKHCPTIAHQMCQAVYCYMSVARGSHLLRALRRIPPLYSLGWRPRADNLLAVFKNWVLKLDSINIPWFIPTEVLIHMSSSLPFISARGETDVDALLAALVLASLDPLILISLNMTLLKQNIRALIDNIPEQDWGPDKIVSFACTLLDLDSHLHNMCAISMMFVEMDGRSKEVGLCLSVHLIKLMLATLLPSHKVVPSSCNLATVGDTNDLPTKGGVSFSTLACSSNEFVMDHSANVSSLVHNLNDFNMVDESNHLKKAAQNLIAVFKTILQNLPNDFMCTDTSTLKSMITRTIMTWNDFLQMGTCGYHEQ
uniref:Coiled-coil SMC6 And NSE5 INteracting (CANIN) domain-containing protein n=1 Tax=Timema douglasi TaxID=61478 RepID=A0A7R8VCX5_TIMDO|nr:unnamed protein product [Timema douglasi]